MRIKTWCFVAALSAVLCGCPKPPVCNPEEEDCGSDAGPPPDVCNNRDEALSDPQCELTVTTTPTDGGALKLGFLSVAMDQDWYVAKMPALTARSLVHVTAGYSAPATPVNLAVSVFKEDGTTGLVRKIDKHGAAAPRPVDIIFPYAEANSKLLVVLSDEGATSKTIVDLRNQYAVGVEVIDNPDLNEPNDVTPTVIPLTAAGPGLQGQAKGAIATDDDVDRFKFTAPGGRKIIYLHLTAPKLMPQPPFRLAYVLLDPTGKPVAEGQVANEFIPVDLATARLSTAGDYTVVIQGYKPPSSTTVTPGDLRMIYTLDVQIMDDLDTNEPNDSVTAPKVVPMSYGSSLSFTGKLAYVPDPDVFALDLAATGNAGVLRYRLTVSPGGGRFPPLAPVSDLQLRVVTQITAGATLGDRQLACKSNTPLCPKGYEGSLQNQSLVEGLCDGQDPPWCLWMERNEDKLFANLKNLEGTIPVPGHPGATARYLLFVQDEGNNYADDRDYQLTVAYEADPDDTARAATPGETQGVTLSEAASFPNPVTAGEVTGVLTHGYGRVIDNRIDQGQGVRAANDYDAVPTDYDKFDFSFPSIAAFPFDRAWALQWEIGHNDAGSPPAALALEVGFCTGPSTADGGCASVNRVLAYSSDTLQPWYGTDLLSRGVLFTKQVNANNTVITAEPLGCFCFEPRFITTGHYLMRVGSVDRVNNQPINYRIRQSLAAYPPSYSLDGGTFSCPQVTDGGASCRFSATP